jgi:hypothetical protein
MKTTKMSLANIQGKLSRTEMKNIMAGSGRCDSCWGSGGTLAHSNSNGTYGAGMCPSSTGGTSCHNYCSQWGTGGSYWC